MKKLLNKNFIIYLTATILTITTCVVLILKSVNHQKEVAQN